MPRGRPGAARNPLAFGRAGRDTAKRPGSDDLPRAGIFPEARLPVATPLSEHSPDGGNACVDC